MTGSLQKTEDNPGCTHQTAGREQAKSEWCLELTGDLCGEDVFVPGAFPKQPVASCNGRVPKRELIFLPGCQQAWHRDLR